MSCRRSSPPAPAEERDYFARQASESDSEFSDSNVSSPVQPPAQPLPQPQPQPPAQSLTQESKAYGLSIAEPLNRPVIGTFTTKALHSLVYEGKIELNPAYQRDVVWSDERQSNLIDSLLGGFWVPPIVFAETEGDLGSRCRVCVDGKQRLTSIVRFIDGHIPYKDLKGNRWYYTVPPSKPGVRTRSRRLPDHLRSRFAETTLTCVDYRNISIETEHEIFSRVQSGLVLTVAERLKAINSPRAEWIRQLVEEHAPIDSGLSVSLPKWRTTRGNAFQCIAQLAYCCDHYPGRADPDTGKVTSWLSSQEDSRELVKIRVSNALHALQNIVTKPALKAVVKDVRQGVAPVEFVYLGLILYSMNKYSMEVRATSAYKMRVYVRQALGNGELFRRKGTFDKFWEAIEALHSEAENLDERTLLTSRARQPSKRLLQGQQGSGRPAKKPKTGTH